MNRMRVRRKNGYYSVGCIVMAMLVMFLSAACGSREEYSRYESEFTDLFDTQTTVIGYAKTEAEFESYVRVIYDRLAELHRYYDIYHDYEGVVNIKTINDNAGKAPVAVGEDLLGLLRFAKETYELTDGVVNIAMGSVLRVWHAYRDEGLANPEAAALPPMDGFALCETDIMALVIDEEARTVFLKERGMSLDAGAIAKGYAARLAAEAAREAGLTSAVLNMGGNVVCIGQPPVSTREKWGIGVKNPYPDERDILIDAVYVSDMSVVTSGGYQRYYIVDGKRYSHIIDPQTHMPAGRYEAVTVVHADSAVADALSTALFIMPYEEGLALAARCGAEALWMFPDTSQKETEGFAKLAGR